MHLDAAGCLALAGARWRVAQAAHIVAGNFMGVGHEVAAALGALGHREHAVVDELHQAPGAGEGSWRQVPDVLQAASGADALLLLTEWQAFAQIDWPALAAVMRRPACLFEARAKADAAAARAAGLQVWTVGEG